MTDTEGLEFYDIQTTPRTRTNFDDSLFSSASLAYNVQVLLDRMSDGQLIFDAVLRNASHPITQDLSDITTHGISQAMMESPLGPRYHTATITKFSDTREMVMPASVNDMVSLLLK